jgi:hypothetical protein
MIRKQIVFMYMAQGVVEESCRWVKAELDVNDNPKRLLETRIQNMALAIVDANGFFIKRPPQNIIGSVARVYTTGLYWLGKNSKFLTDTLINELSEKKTLSTLGLDSVRAYVSYLSSNNPYDQIQFTSFLKEVLPKGTPSLV